MARKATGQVVERKRTRGRVFALRFRAGGQRQYITLPDGTSREEAERELRHVLADVERGAWRPPEPVPEIELPESEPTFHEFASEWLAMREHELSERTVEDYKWALTQHLLPYFAKYRLSEITPELVDRYTATKAQEKRLSNNSVNKTLTRLRQVFEDSVEYGYVERNPAAGRRRRLKTDAPRRERMEAEQVAALLGVVSGTHRALLATAIMAGGLRVSEVTGLRWRDVNLASGWLSVEDSKTVAGIRRVDLEPDLLDELVGSQSCGRPLASR
jgi:integrase